jgi:hypothetical protein
MVFFAFQSDPRHGVAPDLGIERCCQTSCLPIVMMYLPNVKQGVCVSGETTLPIRDVRQMPRAALTKR